MSAVTYTMLAKMIDHSLLNPVLYLAAFGIGLGKIVNRGGHPLGVPYLDYVAPGMLAAVCMQLAAFHHRFRDVRLGPGLYDPLQLHLQVVSCLDAIVRVFGHAPADHALQCGYCTSGMIMSATALLRESHKPTDEQILAYMNTHVCRCGTYPRILAAIKRAALAPTTGGAK